MSIEEQYRRNLDSSLRQVHEFTTGTDFPGGQLVNRMNALLRAAFDTNFGVECSESLAVLYQTIGRVSPDMVTRCEDAPLLFFARSFVVVIEEAMRQLQQSRKVATVSLLDASSGAAEVWSSETPREEHIMQEEKYESDLWSTSSPTDESLPPPFSSPLPPPSETRLDWSAPLTSSTTPGKSPTATGAAQSSGLFGCEEWRRRMQNDRTDKILDFSFETLKGRVNFFSLPLSAQAHDVRTLLKPFGPILEFYFCMGKGDRGSYALTKLESNWAAAEAISRLHTTVMNGKKITVKKATYWTRLHTDPSPSEPRPSMLQQLQLFQKQRSCSQKLASVTVAAAPAAVAAPCFWPDLPAPTSVAAAVVAAPDTVVAQAAAAASVVDFETVYIRAEPDSDDESHDSMFSVD